MPDASSSIWKQLQIATAVGGVLVVTFWVLYFTANDALGLVDPAIAPFEESFLVPDAVFATILFATSIALRHRKLAAPFLLAIAASMSLYLGILDATFYARNGLFLPVTGAGITEAVINLICIGGGLYGLRAAWIMWRTV